MTAITRGHTVHVVIYGLLLALATIAVPVLSLVGVNALLDSRDGEVIDPVLDPTEPGYQALVSPSPTLLVVHTDPEGALVGVAVLALAGEDAPGGSVLLVPPSTLASVPDFGDLTLEYVQPLNGTDTTRSLTEWILGIGLDDVVELDRDSWTELLGPIGGVTITNPDELRNPDGSVRFAPGELTLRPDDVAPYLEHLGEGENPLNRVLRHELVWSALLEAVADHPGTLTFPGEADRGLARFIPALARGTNRIDTLPVTLAPDGPSTGASVVLLPDDHEIATLIPRLVPFPAGARPGDRPLTRLLDGSGRPDVVNSAVRQVAIGGGQVVMIGNSDTFDVEETQLLYSDEAVASVAESVAVELGVGSVQRVDYIDESAELIIILGSDYTP